LKNIEIIDGSNIYVTMTLFEKDEEYKKLKHSFEGTYGAEPAVAMHKTGMIILNGRFFKALEKEIGHEQMINDLCNSINHEIMHEVIQKTVSCRASKMMDNLYYRPEKFSEEKPWGLLGKAEMNSVDISLIKKDEIHNRVEKAFVEDLKRSGE